jgi:hypothetical protein
MLVRIVQAPGKSISIQRDYPGWKRRRRKTPSMTERGEYIEYMYEDAVGDTVARHIPSRVFYCIASTRALLSIGYRPLVPNDFFH